MRRALEALLAVLIAAAVLPTAVDHLAAPAGPSADEVAVRNQEVADATWDSLPFSPGFERPEIELGESISEDEWPLAFGTCLGEMGFEGSVSTGPDGIPQPQSTQIMDDQALLAFYTCVVAHPKQFTTRSFYSAAQLDYQYEHFTTWLIPCLAQHGYRLMDSMPTAEEFHDLGGGWSPFSALDDPTGRAVDTESDYVQVTALCGAMSVGLS